jgi:glycosyltransferase involved in cell wall biosynthesis
MKVALPVDSKQTLGGGFTFQRNLARGLKNLGVVVVDDPFQADLALISGVTMITKETFRALRDSNVKTVIRLDNVPRNSRNRGSGTSRLKNFSQQADAIIWQSFWAKSYLQDFIDPEQKLKQSVIYNGIDLDVFKATGDHIQYSKSGTLDDVYLYSRYSRDETKMWEVAWYEYQLIQKRNKDAQLLIVGRFSDDVRNNNFDFFRGENVRYLGVIDEPEQMSTLLRSCGWLMATYFNDAFSNTYLEALCSGVQFYRPNMSGGTPEMINLYNVQGREYFSLDRMAKDYAEFFEEVLNAR